MTPEITGEYKHKKFFSKNTVRQKKRGSAKTFKCRFTQWKT